MPLCIEIGVKPKNVGPASPAVNQRAGGGGRNLMLLADLTSAGAAVQTLRLLHVRLPYIVRQT